MIWYDTVTKDPVAPGSCEDGGTPSIESYECYSCQQTWLPDYEFYGGIGYGKCPNCGFVVLVQA